MKSRKILALGVAFALSFCLAGCGSTSSTTSSSSSTNVKETLQLSNKKWKYDKTNKVYYQIKLMYCTKPVDTKYETMGVYVPGAYMTGKANGDGTYTCSVNKTGKVNGFSATSAPIVYPVETPGYASQAAPTSYSYSTVSSYIKAGYIYVLAGMRGRASMMGGSTSSSSDASYSMGAPWGVTDLKAAIRYYRYNASLLPGNTDKIFTFGMSGGGAQSALAGATGNSSLYAPYLQSIGAVLKDKNGKTVSDAVAGSMCWCPITNLDSADAAYEWCMGQFFSSSTRASSKFTSALSKDLATAYANYINKLKLSYKGQTLTLSKSTSGIYMSGTYYNYLKDEVETSLNHFLKDTTFPYTPDNSTQAGMSASTKGKSGSMPQGKMGGGSTTSSSSSTTYKTVASYIKALNSDTTWVKYNASTHTAKITSLSAFIKKCKSASKSVGAFDSMSKSQAENNVFGNAQSISYHFDSMEYDVLKANASQYAKYSDYQSSYLSAFKKDLARTDSVGTSMSDRVNMYTPLYYLSDYYKGYKTSTVAKYWRIRTGINQSDTSLTTEENLKLALENYSGVKDVDFATVWGLAHTTAERTGSATTNFIAWVKKCAQ